MTKSLVVAIGVAVLVAGAGTAQGQNGGLANPVCPAGTSPETNAAQDACQRAYDVYQFMAPQLGLAIAGGNHTLGQNSTLGGFPHFSIGVRGTAFNGNLPQVDQFRLRTSGASPAVQLPTKSQFIGLPGADVAIGVFGGLPLALTNVGGVDLLLSATFVPSIDQSNVSVKPNNNLQIGYGARIGLLSESLLVPGVSFTYLKRDLPTTTITGSAAYTDVATGSTNMTISVNNLKVKTSGWRLVASKSLVLFALAAGVGQDKYDNSADITGTATGTIVAAVPPRSFNTTIAVPGTSQSLTRTNYFLNTSLNLFLAKLTAEIGQVSGGTVNTYNTFQSGRADKAQTYGSVGFRFGF